MKLKNHELIQTEDGSYTVYSKNYNENAHSLHGATNETKTHYLQGCEVERARDIKPFHILEIGFGIGIGFKETFNLLKTQDVFILSVEIDEELIELFNEQNPELELIKTSEGVYTFKFENFTLKVLIGDARVTLANRTEKFHAIYQDAYSPRRNPILWTVEWFTLLKGLSKPDVIMSTYSASSSIRKSMVEAGFKLSPGVKFGQKRSSTRAKLEGESDQDILDHLSRSPVLALYDKDCDTYRKRD